MLKVYRVKKYVSVNNGKWYRVGQTDIKMIDESKSQEVIIDNGSFDTWYEYLQEHYLDGIYARTTFFKNKPLIVSVDILFASFPFNPKSTNKSLNHKNTVPLSPKDKVATVK